MNPAKSDGEKFALRMNAKKYRLCRIDLDYPVHLIYIVNSELLMWRKSNCRIFPFL